MTNILINCFGGCLSLLEFDFRSPEERQKGIIEQAKEISRMARNIKGECYYTSLKKLIDKSSEILLSPDQLDLEDSILNDALVFQNIIKYKKARAIPELQKEIKEALKKGFPAKVLQSLVGFRINVEAQTEESVAQKFKQYIEVLSTDCSVCYGRFSQADFVKQRILRLSGCHHFYHTECIEESLRHKSQCPVCRKELSSSVYKREKAIWQEYLASIQGDIKERFPNVPAAELEDLKKDPDEELARMLQAEEDARAELAEQRAADAQLALELTQRELALLI